MRMHRARSKPLSPVPPQGGRASLRSCGGDGRTPPDTATAGITITIETGWAGEIIQHY